MTAPTPQPRATPRQPSTAAKVATGAAIGIWGIYRIIRLAIIVLVVAFVGFGIWGYHQAHTPQFKLECAAYQIGMYQMSFPDNMLCSMFYGN